MKKITFLLFFVALTAMSAHAQGLVAAFSADEAAVPYYQMGWDTADEFDTWTYQATSYDTWEMGSSNQSFQSIDPSSTASMVLSYGSGQYETATSPAIDIRPGSTLEFYCYASGIYLVYGAWKLYAITGDGSTLLIDQFMWAQNQGYDGPSWERFTVDLTPFVGQSVQFSFVYQGNYGEDEAIDGFKILQANDSDDAVINLKEGESVHFKDLSSGNVTEWKWAFEGGTPATSNEQNPVITYNKAGSYAVTLTVGDGTATDTKTRTGYENVSAEAPVAHVGLPVGAYLSPWVMMFVPVNVPLTFMDASTGNPTSWTWTFDGTDVTTSHEQNPTVSYLIEGTYGLKLEVANDMGSSVDEYANYAIQAGGEQEIWNIAPEENADLEMIEMGWYGNYGGTNWLGMPEFAEHFQAPLAPAQIDSVAVYFAKTTCVTTDADITVKIVAADEQGMPAQVLAQSTLKASELKYDEQNVVETIWHFDQPVKVDGEFFVTIGGFPNNDGDDIAMLVHRRGEGQKCTAWQYVLDDDGAWGYLETGQWYENVDDPMSFAISPILDYEVTDLTALPNTVADRDRLVNVNGGMIELQGAEAVYVYDLNGRLVLTARADASLNSLPSGAYIVRAQAGDRVQTIKVIK